MTSAPTLESTLGRENARGWTKSLDRCETILPLADGRFLVIHGTNGSYHPVTDVYDTLRKASEAAVARLEET